MELWAPSKQIKHAAARKVVDSIYHQSKQSICTAPVELDQRISAIVVSAVKKKVSDLPSA